MVKRASGKDKQPRFSEKLPPHNREAEESVVASLVISADEYMDEVSAFLKPAHFHDERNGWCFEAMSHLYARSVPIDEISVNQELERIGRLNEVGGLGYLSLLVSRLTIDLHCVHWAHLVHNCYILQQLIRKGALIAAKAYEGKVNDVEQTIQECQEIFMGIWNEVGETPFVITDLVKTTSDPPQYSMKVNGIPVTVAAEDLLDFKRFRKMVMIRCNFVPARQTDDEWTMCLNRLFKGVREMTAPPEISTDYSYWQAALNVIRSLPYVDTEDEFDDGYPMQRGKHIYLQGSSFIGLWQQKIRQNQGTLPNISILWGIMNSQGGKKSQVRFGEKFRRAWQLPLSLMDQRDNDLTDDGDDSDLFM